MIGDHFAVGVSVVGDDFEVGGPIGPESTEAGGANPIGPIRETVTGSCRLQVTKSRAPTAPPSLKQTDQLSPASASLPNFDQNIR